MSEDIVKDVVHSSASRKLLGGNVDVGPFDR